MTKGKSELASIWREAAAYGPKGRAGMLHWDGTFSILTVIGSYGSLYTKTW